MANLYYFMLIKCIAFLVADIRNGLFIDTIFLRTKIVVFLKSNEIVVILRMI